MVSVTIICIGIFFHILWQTVGYLAFLYILRRRTGGYHLSRFISCYSCSIALFVMIYYLLHNVAALIQVGIFGVFVVSGIVIEIIGTVNHPKYVYVYRQRFFMLNGVLESLQQ